MPEPLRVFVAAIELREVASEKAEELDRQLKEVIYDALDEAGVGYKCAGLGIVDTEAEFDEVFEREASPDANGIGGFREGDPDTSRKGAVDAYPRSGQHRHTILIEIAKSGDQGMTYEEVEEKTGIKNAHKRISELRQGDWLRSAGERVAKKTGSMSNIWVITERAERWIETKERAGVLA